MTAVVVTGSAGGIGASVVARLAASGFAVVGLDRVEGDTGAVVEQIIGDVTDPDAHARAAKAAESLGGLTGWVNAAGIAEEKSVDEITAEDYRRVFGINFAGTLFGVSAAVRAMIATRAAGSIVSMSSTQAQKGLAGYPLYAASKGAIDALTRQVAAEFASRGIRCNAIAPGVIATPMNEALLASADDPVSLAASWDALCPIGRWGRPEDVAALVCYLVGAESGFLTGQIITLDGGQTIATMTGA